MLAHRHLIPGSAVQLAARPFFQNATPLLEKEWNPGRSALVADLS
jgi:hypothetical protein